MGAGLRRTAVGLAGVAVIAATVFSAGSDGDVDEAVVQAGSAAVGAPASAATTEPASLASRKAAEKQRFTLWAAVDHIVGPAEHRENGYAGVKVHGATIDLFWKGRVDAAVMRAVAEVRRDSDIAVKIRRAAHSEAELSRVSARLNRSARLTALGIDVIGTTSPPDGSGLDLMIMRVDGLSAAERAARRALAKREGTKVAGVPILKVYETLPGRAA